MGYAAQCNSEVNVLESLNSVKALKWISGNCRASVIASLTMTSMTFLISICIGLLQAKITMKGAATKMMSYKNQRAAEKIPFIRIHLVPWMWEKDELMIYVTENTSEVKIKQTFTTFKIFDWISGKSRFSVTVAYLIIVVLERVGRGSCRPLS